MKGIRLLRGRDLALLAAILLFALACLLFARPIAARQGASARVDIYAGGSLYASVPLDGERELTIRQENGAVNTLCISADGFYMRCASCPDQRCVRQGAVTLENYAARALGTRVVCLPNQVVAELTLLNQTPDPALPDL